MTDEPPGPEAEPPPQPATEPPPEPAAEPPPEPAAEALPPASEPAHELTADDAILPPVLDPAALGDAVGARSQAEIKRRIAREEARDRREAADADAPTTNRRTVMIAAGAIIAGLTAAALGFLGHANAERYMIACEPDHVSPEQGRGFPPWGSHPLIGPEWKPIALPTNAECKPRETDDSDQLAHWYLDILVDRASTTLTGRNLLEAVPSAGATAPNPLDVVAGQLEQALLLARSPDRRDQRKEIERLQGDVQYWRASGRLRDAAAAVGDAAKQFEAAATQRPRHAADADAWATFLRRVEGELRGGPTGPTGSPPTSAGAAPLPTSATPTAPVGVALPVEPPAEPEAPPAPDAGVATGGVLL